MLISSPCFFFSFTCAGVIVRFFFLWLSILWIQYEKSILAQKVINYPKVSLLIPAYNEAETIIKSLTHAINQNYPELEIIVINDGSSDQTLELLEKSFTLTRVTDFYVDEKLLTQPIKGLFKSRVINNLLVVDKVNGGKADALNCAINISSSDYLLCLDADTVLTNNTIKYLIRPFLLDDSVVVTSGSVRVMSKTKKYSLFQDLQKIEFINSISLFRAGWNFINANLIISGALGLFKKDILITAGGYHNLAIGEDMEIIVRIHRKMIEKSRTYKIIQLAFPTCFTSAVPNLKAMSNQRKRWQKGLLSTLSLNMNLILNYKYKGVGLAGIPFYILFEIIGPFAEIAGLLLYLYLLTASLSPKTPLYLWLGSLLLGIINNWLAISLDKFLLRGMSWPEYARLLISSIIDPFFYHFFQIYFKINGTIEYFSSIHLSAVWNTKR